MLRILVLFSQNEPPSDYLAVLIVCFNVGAVPVFMGELELLKKQEPCGSEHY